MASTANKVNSLLTGTAALGDSLERARETAAMDNLLLQQGDVMHRYNDMILRRKVSALAMQHRVTQHLDKEISLLREALGLPPLPPEEVVRTHVTMRDPTNAEDLEVASTYDAKWAKGVTVRNLTSFKKTLLNKGYSYRSEASDRGLRQHKFTGRIAGGIEDTFVVHVLGNSWCVGAERNGSTLPLFNFNPTAATASDRGLPPAMASDFWDGTFSNATAQKYATDWIALIGEV